jgi:hypothetical protein
MANRLTGNQIWRGQLYTPDSERVPRGLYDYLEEQGQLETQTPTLANPINGYDTLTVDQVVSQLDMLDDGQKAQILAYEQANKGRVGIVNALEGFSE